MQLQSAPTSSKNVNDQLPTGLDSKRFDLKDAHRLKRPGKALHSEGDFMRKPMNIPASLMKKTEY